MKADLEVKLVSKNPLIFRASTNTKGIKNLIKRITGMNISHEWCNYNHLYKSINPLGETFLFPINVSRRDAVAYLRFRMCRTRITHRRLFDSSGPSQCMFCFNDELTISHLIDDCPETVVICQNFFFSYFLDPDRNIGHQSKGQCQNLQIDNLYNILTNVSEKNIKNFTKFLRFANSQFRINNTSL